MSDLVVELRKVAWGSVFPGEITGAQKEYLDGLREIMDAAADEIERLRRVEEQYKELKAAAWNVEKAFLHNQGSMDMAIDTLSDLLQEGE